MNMMTRQFSLPLPPSINQQYASVGNKRVLSSESRAFKRAVSKEVSRLRAADRLDEPFLAALRRGFLGLFLDFYFETPLRRDLDGGLKIAQDALCEALKLNDNRVVDVHLVKRVDPTHPRVEVELVSIPEWTFDDREWTVKA